MVAVLVSSTSTGQSGSLPGRPEGLTPPISSRPIRRTSPPSWSRASLAKAAVAALGAPGFNVAVNNGRAAGQWSITCICTSCPASRRRPRTWHGKPYAEGEIGKVADRIRTALRVDKKAEKTENPGQAKGVHEDLGHGGSRFHRLLLRPTHAPHAPGRRSRELRRVDVRGQPRDLKTSNASALSLREGDILDGEAVRAALAGVDAVIHFGRRVARRTARSSIRRLLPYQRAGTQVLLEACRKAGVQRLPSRLDRRSSTASSSSTTRAVSREEDRLHRARPTPPRRPAPTRCDGYAHSFGIATTISRCCNNTARTSSR